MTAQNLFCSIFGIDVDIDEATLYGKKVDLKSMDNPEQGLPIVLLVLHHFHQVLTNEEPVIFGKLNIGGNSVFGFSVTFKDYNLLSEERFQDLIPLVKKILNEELWFKNANAQEKLNYIATACRDWAIDRAHAESTENRKIDEFELNSDLEYPKKHFMGARNGELLHNTKLVAKFFLSNKRLKEHFSNIFEEIPFFIRKNKTFPKYIKLQNNHSPINKPLTDQSPLVDNKSENRTKRYKMSQYNINKNKLLIALSKQISTVVSAKSKLDSGGLVKEAIKSFPDVDDTLFLSAIMGSHEVMNKLGVLFQCPPSQIKFPEIIYTAREQLFDVFEERTFESTTGNNTNWFDVFEANVNNIKLVHSVNYVFQLFLCDKDNFFTLEPSKAINLLNDNEDISPLLREFFVTNLTVDEIGDDKAIEEIEEKLHNTIVGQFPAKSALIDNLIVGREQKGSDLFTFLGKSGVGKTVLAETFGYAYSESLETGHQVYVINCESYSNQHDVGRLFGSGQQYVDSYLGELTSAVSLYPRQIIIFDEIEKAHAKVQQSLLTLIDRKEIRCYTSGRKVDFSQCRFIFTSNLGANYVDDYLSSKQGVELTDLLSDCSENLFVFNTSTAVPPLSKELVNRLNSGHIIPLGSLTEWDIAELFFQQAQEFSELIDLSSDRISSYQKYQIPALLIRSYSGDFSARSITNCKLKLLASMKKHLKANQINSQETLFLEHDLIQDNKLSGLLVSNDKGLLSTIASNLKGEAVAFEAQYFSSRCDVSETKSYNEFDFILVDPRIEHFRGLSPAEFIEHLNNKAPAAKVIMLENAYHEQIELYYKLFPLVTLLREYGTNSREVNYHIFISKKKKGVFCKFNDFLEKPSITAGLAKLPFAQLASNTRISLDDVIGLSTAKYKLLDSIEKVVNWRVNQEDTPPKGALLHGKPGTGKTFLMQAISNQFSIPLISVNAPDLTIGNSELNVDLLFKELKANAPCILFIDEFDSIGQKRQANNVAKSSLVNKLLTAINGFENATHPIYIVAATNNPTDIDPALLRPGRIEEQIVCDLPNEEEAFCYLQKLSIKHQVAFNDDELKLLTLIGKGQTIGALEKAFKTQLYDNNLFACDLERIQLNLCAFGKGELLLNEPCNSNNMKVRAVHEAGHLLSSKLLSPEVKVTSCSIIATTHGFGGWTSIVRENSSLYSNKSLSHDIQVLLAGRASEQLIMGETSSSSVADINEATRRLKAALEKDGMFDNELLINTTQFNIEQTTLLNLVNTRMKSEYETVLELLKQNQEKLHDIAEVLLQKKVIFYQDIEFLFSQPLTNSPKSLMHH